MGSPSSPSPISIKWTSWERINGTYGLSTKVEVQSEDQETKIFDRKRFVDGTGLETESRGRH